MRRGARLVLVVAIAIAVVFALTACAQGDPTVSPGYVSGDGTVTVFDPPGDIVELTGEDFAGNQVDVSAFRGTVVLLNTWYASCPPCRAEAADLVTLDGRDDVQVIGINTRDDAATAEAFERTFDVDYPSINDRSARAVAALQGLVSISAVPTTLVLDTDGRVVARVIGQIDLSTMEGLIEDAYGDVP